MKISIGSDHAGYELKQYIKDYLHSLKLLIKVDINDWGTYSDNSCDYADYAHLVSKDIEESKSKFGILICGSGNGIAMSANKWSKVRASICWCEEITKLSRMHNDSNIIVLPSRFISKEDAIKYLDIFINTSFDGERHVQRINKIQKK